MEAQIMVMEETIRRWKCPVCGAAHASRDAAERCLAAGKWLEGFDPKDYLWKWVIVHDSRFSYNNFKAIIPRQIDKHYSWAGEPPCMGRPVSFFNSFSNSYVDLMHGSPWNVERVLGISEGFEKYRLLPPIERMEVPDMGMPQDTADEINDVLSRAMELRIREISDAISPSPAGDILARLIAAELVPSLKAQIGIAADKMSRLTETSLIYGEKLFELEKNIPEFAGY